MRKVFLVINGLLIAALAIQFYLSAVGVFSNPDDGLFAWHGLNGRFVLPALVILWIIFGFVAKIGGRNIGLTFVVLGLLALQTVLFLVTGMIWAEVEQPPLVASLFLGLHGLNGTIILLLTVWVFAKVRSLDRVAPEAERIPEVAQPVA